MGCCGDEGRHSCRDRPDRPDRGDGDRNHEGGGREGRAHVRAPAQPIIVAIEEARARRQHEQHAQDHHALLHADRREEPTSHAASQCNSTAMSSVGRSLYVSPRQPCQTRSPCGSRGACRPCGEGRTCPRWGDTSSRPRPTGPSPPHRARNATHGHPHRGETATVAARSSEMSPPLRRPCRSSRPSGQYLERLDRDPAPAVCTTERSPQHASPAIRQLAVAFANRGTARPARRSVATTPQESGHLSGARFRQ